MLTVLILTRDEAQHIQRALASVSGIADRIFVVDSGSRDETRELAEAFGAKVHVRDWTTYADQFNWALDQLRPDTEWILRLDADEVVSPDLAQQMREHLADMAATVSAVSVRRRMNFLGQPIRHGGLFPIEVIRIFRHGKARCEARWMDEHIVTTGQVVAFSGEIVDDNRNSLTWWTEKHNAYASREVVDLLNLEYRFAPLPMTRSGHGKQAGRKRWLKEKIYARLPVGVRAAGYFLYRYVVRLGFLDGRRAVAFHVLQGFWYRYLVDIKLIEVRQFMTDHHVDVETAIERVLGIDPARGPSH